MGRGSCDILSLATSAAVVSVLAIAGLYSEDQPRGADGRFGEGGGDGGGGGQGGDKPPISKADAREFIQEVNRSYSSVEKSIDRFGDAATRHFEKGVDLAHASIEDVEKRQQGYVRQGMSESEARAQAARDSLASLPDYVRNAVNAADFTTMATSDGFMEKHGVTLELSEAFDQDRLAANCVGKAWDEAAVADRNQMKIGAGGKHIGADVIAASTRALQDVGHVNSDVLLDPGSGSGLQSQYSDRVIAAAIAKRAGTPAYPRLKADFDSGAFREAPGKLGKGFFG